MGRAAVAAAPVVDWQWIDRHGSLIRHELWEHILLTAIAVVMGLVIAAALSLVAAVWPRLRGGLIGVCGALYAVPSLALFALLVPVTGFTTTTAEIGLVGYTLLILLRNILVGLDGVPSDVHDAATGLGYGRARMLLRVDAPLALPATMAGIRVATVTTIGLVTVTSLIGQGGLGFFLLDGFARSFNTEVWLGAVLAIGLAVVADAALVGVERLVAPWARAKAS